MTKILPVASGSSGNALLYTTERAKILIDAGSNTKTIKKALETEGLSLADLTHIFITHTHNDHIAALNVMLKHTPAKLYISENAYTEFYGFKDRALTFTYGETVDANGIEVKNFRTSHDSFGSVGYVLGDGKRDFGYCTDLGYVTEEVVNAVKDCHTLYIESNHDVEMLKRGPYPYFLKERILSMTGHISNKECAALAVHLAKQKTRNFILAHLSEQNNTPAKALLETENALFKAGADEGIRVLVAQKKNTNPPIILE
ncbi:MAG: MBL fold metallo-hydrolase [Clostridia bacterium]|nr:MBL fold metallo-hydrolase [Clostridia bacterium]